MSVRKETGTVSQLFTDTLFEWAVDVFSYMDPNVCLVSPSFSVAGSLWYLKMYPFGRTYRQTVGWIDLFLILENDSGEPKSGETTFSLGVKKVDGTVENLKYGLSHVFNDTDFFWYSRFLRRTILLERKDELAPSGILAVTCTLRHNERVKPISKSLLRLSEDLQSMFFSKSDYDVTLKVGDEEFSVHKSVLKSRSPVFKAMFEVDMKEKNTGIVDIKDCTPEAFKDFLMFIYSGNFTNSSNDAFQLYRIAHKYDVKELMWDCVVYIKNNLSIDNVIDAVITGHLFDEEELKKKRSTSSTKTFQKFCVLINGAHF